MTHFCKHDVLVGGTLPKCRECESEQPTTDEMRATVTLSELPQLKRLYHRAVNKGDTQFTFKGKTLVTAYAKYVIQYFEYVTK